MGASSPRGTGGAAGVTTTGQGPSDPSGQAKRPGHEDNNNSDNRASPGAGRFNQYNQYLNLGSLNGQRFLLLFMASPRGPGRPNRLNGRSRVLATSSPPRAPHGLEHPRTAGLGRRRRRHRDRVLHTALVAGRGLFAWLAAAEVIALAACWRNNGTGQLVMLALLLAWLGFAYREFWWGLVFYLQNNLGQAFLLGLSLLMIWGGVLSDVGLPDLIWYETPVGRFLSAMGSVLLLAVLGVNAYFLDDRNERNQEAIARLLGRNPVNYGLGNLQGVWLLGLLPGFLGLARAGPSPGHGMADGRDGGHAVPAPGPLAVPDPGQRCPALYPLVFPNVPRLAPVRDLPRTLSFLFGEPPATFLGCPMPLFRRRRPWCGCSRGLPDVGRDPRAWLLGLSLWVSGLLTGVIAVKIFVGFSVLLEGLYHWAVGPGIDWFVRVYRTTVGPLFGRVGAAVGGAYGLAVGAGPMFAGRPPTKSPRRSRSPSWAWPCS